MVGSPPRCLTCVSMVSAASHHTPVFRFHSPPSAVNPGPPADPQVPDTLGWRCWRWDHAHRRLVSPSLNTVWLTSRLDAINWDTSAALRGSAGIHARLVPKKWRETAFADETVSVSDDGALVVGIVERFGKYVLGTQGWRAESVAIRELLAPSTDVGLLIEQAYPDVKVHYRDQGDDTWTSAESSASASASQPTSPSLRPTLYGKGPIQVKYTYQPLPPLQNPLPPLASPPPSSPPSPFQHNSLMMQQHHLALAQKMMDDLIRDLAADLHTPLIAAKPKPKPPRPSLLRRLLSTNWFWWAFLFCFFYGLMHLLKP